MELASLRNLKSKNGSPKMMRTSFQKDLRKDLLIIAKSLLAKRAFVPILGMCPQFTNVSGGIAAEIEVTSQSDVLKISNRIKPLDGLYVARIEKIKGTTSLMAIGIEHKRFANQLAKLSDVKKKVATDILEDYAILIVIHLKGGKKEIAKEIGKIKKTSKKSTLTSNSLTFHDLGLKLKIKYSIDVLDSIIDDKIKKYESAYALLSAILDHARELNEKSGRIRSDLVIHDLHIVETNFLLVAAAVSALHANPKAKLMFTSNDSFVLFDKKRPLARFGKALDSKMPMKKKFEMCRKECGAFPGNSKAIMDVLDAEGKKGAAAVKELFNDLSKHVVTHSSGVASKAAKRLKTAAAIESKINWQSFNTAFSEAAKHVKEIKYSPMVERMEAAVKELHRNRNVLKLGQMKWQEIFEKKKLDWLGALSADILEDEVNMKKEAKEALSCVANWMENVVECSLRVHHLGTVGDEFRLSPCKKFKFKTWQIELQDIMKSGPKWK